MKPLLFTIIGLFAALQNARAHIGSPNVFFDGTAGGQLVRVVIRPPVALPGIAQVDIRTERAAAVTVLPVLLGTGDDAAPAPTTAQPVQGDAHLLNAALWLMRSGNYAIRIRFADGPELDVPLRAASLVRPEMPAGLGSALATLGIFLIAAAALIAGAAARESTLAPTDLPKASDLRRGRATALATLILLIAASAYGTVRWRKMDADFSANSLSKPLPVAAEIRTEAERHILTITQPREADVTWASLVTDHGKLMHLFLVETATGRAFAHLHPTRLDYRTFESIVPTIPPGDYTLYGETTHESGSADTVTGTVRIPAPLGSAPQAEWTMANEAWCQSPPSAIAITPERGKLDADDSWHTGPATPSRVAPLMGGAKMILHTPGEFTADRETLLRFTVATATGEPLAIQTYMGMAGHCVIRREDGSVFTHLHPGGSISMAAQQLISRQKPDAPPAPPGSEITFPYAFPQRGKYQVWVQVRAATRVLTGVFEVEVK